MPVQVAGSTPPSRSGVGERDGRNRQCEPLASARSVAARALTQREIELDALSVADDDRDHALAGSDRREPHEQILVADRLAAELDEDVAVLHAALRGRPVRRHRADQQALLLGEPEALALLVGELAR